MRGHAVRLALAISVATCTRADAPAVHDSATRAAGDTASPARADAAWISEIGAGIAVPGDSEGTVIVLDRDPAIRSTALTLLNAGADTSLVLLDTTGAQQCGDAPVLRMRGAAPEGWSAGVFALSARPLRMDSIETLSSGDSARLAAEAARLASALTATALNRFRGLPFTVLSAHRLAWKQRDILVAHLVRRINQEAQPLEEHTLLVAERTLDTAGTQFVVTHSERSEGSEERAEQFDVLAALEASGSLVLLVARDQDALSRYELIQRTGDGAWHPRWTRTVGC